MCSALHTIHYLLKFYISPHALHSERRSLSNNKKIPLSTIYNVTVVMSWCWIHWFYNKYKGEHHCSSCRGMLRVRRSFANNMINRIEFAGMIDGAARSPSHSLTINLNLRLHLTSSTPSAVFGRRHHRVYPKNVVVVVGYIYYYYYYPYTHRII